MNNSSSEKKMNQFLEIEEKEEEENKENFAEVESKIKLNYNQSS